MAAAVDDGTDWAIITRRSVIVSGKKEGKPFVREDFTDSLLSILENVKENVASFGEEFRMVSKLEIGRCEGQNAVLRFHES